MLRQVPCGAIATGFQPYPSDATDTATAVQFPVCKHGGWQECGLQSQQLCAANITGDPLQMAALVDCHFAKGSASGAAAISPTTGSDCADEVSLDYEKIYSCAFEGQYPVPYGLGLLLAAFSEQLSRGVKAVPQMYIDGEQTIAWQDEGALLKAICDAYKGAAKPAGCADATVARLSLSAARRRASSGFVGTELCSTTA